MAPRRIALFTFLAACSDAGVTKFNAPPTATITSHADADVVLEGGSEELRGTVGDPNHNSDELMVSWLVDGMSVCAESAPARGGLVSCLHAVEVGRSTVALEVRDPDGATAVGRVTLTVKPTQPPEATITAPGPNTMLYAGHPFALQGIVSDTEDAATDLTVTWETDDLGDLGLSVDVTSGGDVEAFAALDEGTHAVRLRAVDTLGREGTDCVVLSVGPVNSPPSCTILSPGDGLVVPFGELVALAGEATDPDVDPELLQGSWDSSLDGALAADTLDEDGRLV